MSCGCLPWGRGYAKVVEQRREEPAQANPVQAAKYQTFTNSPDGDRELARRTNGALEQVGEARPSPRGGAPEPAPQQENEMQVLLKKYAKEDGKALSGSRRVFATAAAPISAEIVHLTRRERDEAGNTTAPVAMTQVGAIAMQRTPQGNANSFY